MVSPNSLPPNRAIDPSSSPLGSEGIPQLKGTDQTPDNSEIVKNDLNHCIANNGAQNSWVKASLTREVKTQLAELKSQVKENITDIKQQEEALKILGKLEKNLEEIERHPPENWEKFMTGLFKNFESDFKTIFKSKGKYQSFFRKLTGKSMKIHEMYPFLSYSIAKLGATASNAYVEFIKDSLSQNAVFKDRPEEVKTRLVNKYISQIQEKTFIIAMPKLAEDKTSLHAASNMMKIAILSLPSWFTLVHAGGDHAEEHSEKDPHGDTYAEGGHSKSATITPYATEAEGDGGAAHEAQVDLETSAAVGTESVETSKKAWAGKFPVNYKTDTRFPQHKPLIKDLKTVQKRIKDIQSAIKIGITNRTITKDQIVFYRQELEALEANRQALDTTSVKMTNFTIQTVTTMYKILITVELLHLLELQTQGAVSLHALESQSPEIFTSIFKGLDAVDSELEMSDQMDEALIGEFENQIRDNMDFVLTGLKKISEKADSVFTTKPSEVLAFAVDLVPIAHAFGLGIISGLHAINVKNQYKKRKSILEKQEKINRGNAMINTVFSKRTDMIHHLDHACQSISEKHPRVKLSKTDKKAIETRFKKLEKRYEELDKKLKKARTNDERLAITAEIQDITRENQELFKTMTQLATEIDKEIISTMDNADSVDKEYLSALKQERKDIIGKARELELIAKRKEEFWKSEKMLNHGYQQCIGRYIASTESDVKKAIQLSAQDDAATKVFDDAPHREEMPSASPSKHAFTKKMGSALKSVKSAFQHTTNAHASSAKQTLEKELGSAVQERVEEMEALGDGKATRTLYKNVLKWNLKDLGLSSEHTNALYDFVDYHDRLLRELEQFPENEALKMQVEKIALLESALVGIIANKHKSAEKELSHSTETLLTAFNYSAFNTSQFAVVTATAAGALSNPITAPVLAALSLVCAGVYYKAKIDQSKLPRTAPEVMRQEEVFISSINLLTNPSFLSDIPEEVLSNKDKDLLKEAWLILAGFSQEQQDEMCVRAAFTFDQLTTGEANGGLEELRTISK